MVKVGGMERRPGAANSITSAGQEIAWFLAGALGSVTD